MFRSRRWRLVGHTLPPIAEKPQTTALSRRWPRHHPSEDDSERRSGDSAPVMHSARNGRQAFLLILQAFPTLSRRSTPSIGVTTVRYEHRSRPLDPSALVVADRPRAERHREPHVDDDAPRAVLRPRVTS